MKKKTFLKKPKINMAAGGGSFEGMLLGVQRYAHQDIRDG